MTKLLLILSFSLTGLFYQAEPSEKASQNGSVYICASKGSKKYHYKKNCRGLNACNHEIRKVSLSDARKKYGKTLCGWED